MKRALRKLPLAILLLSAACLSVQQFHLLKLRAEHEELSALAGELHIRDSSKYAVCEFPSQNKAVIMWRWHVPADVKLYLCGQFANDKELREFVRCDRGWAGGGESLGKMGFEESSGDPEQTQLFVQAQGFSTCPNLKPEVGDVIRDHWDQLTIRKLWDSGYVERDANELLTLVEIYAPEDVMLELRKRLKISDAPKNKDWEKRPLFRLMAGDADAFEKAKEARIAQEELQNGR